MLKIYPASSANQDQIQSIAEQTFIETFGPFNSKAHITEYVQQNLNLTKVAEEVADPRTHFFLAIDDGQVVGYLKVNEFGSQTENGLRDSLEIQRIYVLKKYHSKKVGAQLMKLAIQLATQFQVTFIWLGVWEHNERAIQFYEKFGFKRFGQHTFMMGDRPQTDWLMKRPMN